MTTTTRSAEVEAYLAGVAAALADLPADDRQDLLDELGTHLDELSHETDAPLESRLGTPADYAAELRASAGLPPAGARRTGVTRIADRLTSAWADPRARAARELLVALRPAWWVLRGWVVVSALALPGHWSRTLLVFPSVGGGFGGLLLVMLGVVASVQIGRGVWAPVPLGGRRTMLVANVLCAVLLVPVIASMVEAAHTSGYVESYVVEQVPQRGVYAHGERVTNIYTYDSAGKLVTDIRLYDEHGRPLDLNVGTAANRRVLFDSTGVAVQNTYPIRYFERGTRTVTNPSAAPAIVVPPLVAQPMVTPTPTGTPTATGTASPTGTPSPTPSASTKR